MFKLKNTPYWFLLGAFALTMAACSKDDENILNIPEGNNEQVTIDCENVFLELPIETNGKWEATVKSNNEEDDASWIAIINNQGEGSGEVKLAVDYNESEMPRSAIVSLTNGEKTVDYTITQASYDNSDTGENAANYKKYHNSGIGKGLSVKTTTNGNDYAALLKDQIFNYSAMDESIEAEHSNLVTETNITNAKISFSDLISLQNQEKDIKANLSVDISYGLFKLGLSGNFKMYGSERDSIHTYGATASIPCATLQMDYESLLDYLDMSDMTDTNKEQRLKLFSSTFINYHDNIEKYIDNGGNLEGKDENSQKLLNTLNKLDKKFGPVFTRIVTKGGSVDIDFQLKEMESADTLKIGGKLTTSFSSLFSLKVEAAADYMNANKTFTKGSTLNITINGGDLSSVATLSGALKSITSNENSDATKMTEAIVEWSKGVNVENSVIINVTVAGIWELFSDKAADVLKEYFKGKYKNNADGKSPYLYNIEALADE